ncbi:YfkD famly protein [Lederbergia graminis]|uniref:YfkD family protein n=1 Tax=Lederbergia graminis TaxID=735518 RepID=A0ABW0LLW9_9BACI
MKIQRLLLQLIIISSIFMLIMPNNTFAEKDKKVTGEIELPSSVINIEKENTVPNQAENKPFLKPSEFTKELIESANEKIENPHLIRILNESAINSSLLSVGMRATIYLGEYPLNYKSEETTPNWQYQKVNTNVHDNMAGNVNSRMNYVQQVQKRVTGGLTAKVPHAEDVQNMILLKAMEKTKLPLMTQTIIGAGTKHNQVYNIHPKKVGYLHAYVPAIVEKGEATYGEVYLVIKGTKRKIVVKNVTSQKVGAWLPIQNHLTFTFHVTP